MIFHILVLWFCDNKWKKKEFWSDSYAWREAENVCENKKEKRREKVIENKRTVRKGHQGFPEKQRIHWARRVDEIKSILERSKTVNWSLSWDDQRETDRWWNEVQYIPISPAKRADCLVPYRVWRQLWE